MNKIENILYAKLHDIDYDNDTIEEKIIGKSDAEIYIKNVIKDLMCIPNTKKFETQSERTELISIIKDIINIADESACTLENENLIDGLEENATFIANRLKRAEIKAQKENAHLKNKITKGSLLQCFIEVEDGFLFLLSKIEHEPFIDKTDMMTHYGFPIKKITLKCCSIKIDQELNIKEIEVSDTGKNIAKYWRDYFLELKEARNDGNNTTDAFKAIDNMLKRTIKRKSNSDYFLLNQKLKGYFYKNVSFKNTEMIESLFENYVPQSEDIKDEILGKVKERLKKLPENKKFDSAFQIDTSKMAKEFTKPIEISDEFEIKPKIEGINLKERMKSGKTNDGVKYLKIYRINDETYNTFKSDN